MTVKVIHFLSAQEEQTKVNPLNPLGRKLRQLIWETLEDARNDDDVTSIILYGGSQFSAGADLTEFNSMESTSKFMLSLLIEKIETYPKPVVAAISGVALGGGCELALSCHYRVCCNASSSFGLPEVHVGVIPGAGGTQRLPRLIGLSHALPIILQGKPIHAPKALRLGLVDATTLSQSQTLLDCANKWAKWAECMPLHDRRVGQLTMKESPTTFQAIIKHTRKMLPEVNKGGEGVHAALNAISDGCLLPIAQGMEMEATQFMATLMGEQGNARRHTFFAVRNAQKPMITSSSQQQQQQQLSTIKKHPLLRKDLRSQTITGVIGAGLMGSGIALVLLQAGFFVILVDVAKPSLEKGTAFITNTIKSYVKRGKISSVLGQQMISSLRPTMDMNQLHDAKLVVEAVIENLNIKQKIFTSLDTITQPGTILCSNTSTLDIDKMAQCFVGKRRREYFAGLHFFSPAHVMKLVEIIHGTETSPATITLLQQLCKKLKKTAVVVGNCDGFVGNRMLISYGAESAMMPEEGTATVQSMDDALVDFGMVMGPLAMGDLAGLDIGYNIRKERGMVQLSPQHPIPKNRPDRYPEAADLLVSQYRRLGQKTGKGWYDYDKAIGRGRKPIPSKEVSQLIDSLVVKKHGKNHTIQKATKETIIHRVLFPMVNEGFKCLEENIARCPSDIDVIYLYGYGFPAYKGGPMYWADHIVGLQTILRVLEDLYRQFPTTEYYKPSELLKKCVSLNMTVSKYYKLGYHLKQNTASMSKL